MDATKEAGIITVLLERFASQRLPRALAIKDKVDKGEPLSDWDTAFLREALEDIGRAKPLIDEHPELQQLYARAVQLCGEITARALENQKAH